MEAASPLKVNTKCPEAVLTAIYGAKSPHKQADLDESLKRWWRVYSDRKMKAPEEEYTANALLYDPNHLPNSPTAATTPPATDQ